MNEKLNPVKYPTTTIEHETYKAVLDEARRAVVPPLIDPFTVVCGPPKVGKSSMKRQLAQELRLGVNQLETTPVVEVELSLAPKKRFEPKDMLQPMLCQLKDPYLAGMASIGAQTSIFGDYDPIIRKYDIRDAKELRRLTVNRLQLQNCKAVFIDLRQPLIASSERALVTNQIRYIYELASDSQVPHVLFGNYDLVLDEDLFLELAEIGKLIHFPRYTKKQTFGNFKAALGEMGKHIPIDCDLAWDNEQNIDYFYTHSLGCFGKVMELVHAGLKKAGSRKGIATLTIDDIEGNIGYPKHLTRLNEYIKLGEKAMDTNKKSWLQAYEDLNGKSSKSSKSQKSSAKAPEVEVA